VLFTTSNKKKKKKRNKSPIFKTYDRDNINIFGKNPRGKKR